MPKLKLAVGVSGASGMIYAKQLIERLQTDELLSQIDECGIVFSGNAKDIWRDELGNFDETSIAFPVFENSSFYAPFASGSAKYDAMIICPCSMGTLGRISSGISEGLITRASDVMLKERKKLILVTREMPLNLIHINNMKIITEAGGIICPASPAFYHNSENLNEIIDTVIERILDLAGFKIKAKRWKSND
jgi:4-hydroxy-3-polyprenylbenzoate decarboxylase